MLDIASEANEDGMPFHIIVARLVEDEIRNKLRAIAFTARQLNIYPERDEFIVWCSRLAALESFEVVESEAKSFSFSKRENLKERDSDSLATLHALLREVRAFLAYSAKLTALFGVLNPDSCALEAVPAWVNKMAKVRQAFELGPAVASSLLRDASLN